MSGNDERVERIVCGLCGMSNDYFTIYSESENIIGYLNPRAFLAPSNRSDRINPASSLHNPTVTTVRDALDRTMYFKCANCGTKVWMHTDKGEDFLRYGREYLDTLS